MQTLEGNILPTELRDPPIELAPLVEAVGEAIGKLEAATGNRQRARVDGELVEPLHRALATLARREAADMRTWHWLTAAAFPELVWRRWHGAPPAPSGVGDALAGELPRRFLGGTNLSGISRNTFARLWWVADALRDGEDYGAARRALEKQDLFQAVFERRLGLCAPLARVCIERLGDAPEARFRAVTQMVNHFATTTVLEVLDTNGAHQLIQDAERAVDARAV
jgi:hypothetical protein